MKPLIITTGLVLVLTATLGAEPVEKAPKVIRQRMTVERKGAKAAELVIRSTKELARTMTPGEGTGLGKVDFRTSMVVAVRTGTIQYFGVKLNVEKLEISKKGDVLTVHWKYTPYFGGAAPPPVRGSLTLTAVVPSFDGKVKFQKHVHRFKGPFPPSAPPSLPPTVKPRQR